MKTVAQFVYVHAEVRTVTTVASAGCRRSTVMSRDLLTERMFHGWSFNFEEQERIDLARMVSKRVGVDCVGWLLPPRAGAH